MDRSRADEVLREWNNVASNAQRPSGAPKPNMTRTALPAGLLAAAALALVAVIVFGLGARSNQPGAGPSGSSSALPSTIPSANPPGPTSGYSANPSPVVVVPTPTSQPSQKKAAVVASLPNCSPHGGWPYAVSGKHLYVVCYGSDQRPVVADIDLTTNAVLGSYKTNFTYIDSVEVDGGSLWVGGTLGSACVAPCTGFHHILRFDLASGKQVLDLSDWTLRGDGFGYFWATDNTGGLSKLDPATGAVKGHIAFAYETAQFACGSLWGLNTNNRGVPGMTTTVARVNPADGAVLATFTESGKIGEISQTRRCPTSTTSIASVSRRSSSAAPRCRGARAARPSSTARSGSWATTTSPRWTRPPATCWRPCSASIPQHGSRPGQPGHTPGLNRPWGWTALCGPATTATTPPLSSASASRWDQSAPSHQARKQTRNAPLWGAASIRLTGG